MSTLTPHTDYNPVPRVEIDLVGSDVPAGTKFITLLATVEGRSFEVRGVIEEGWAGAAGYLDMEAPFGVPVTYTLVAMNAAKAPIARTNIGTTQVDCNDTLIQQPLNPQLNAIVHRLAATGAEIRRSVDADTRYPEGSVYPVVTARSPRHGITGLVLDVLVESTTMAKRLRATLGRDDAPELPVWLVRTPPPQPIPRLLFCYVPELMEVDLSWGRNIARFSATVDEVLPPAPGLIVPLLEYADLDAAYATYAARDAAYATYADGDSDWTLAGLAS